MLKARKIIVPTSIRLDLKAFEIPMQNIVSQYALKRARAPRIA